MNDQARDAESIFGEAIEIQSVDDRAAFLEQACDRNQQLRAEVERLVTDHFRAGSFLEEPAMHGGAAATMPPMTEQPGMLIGPYKLRERLGAGGMGVVWAAEQKQPLRRKVALKLIKPGMDSEQVLARFEAEREALALMHHPNIASVLDAGTTDQGRPYFVMELIHGIPITEYCDEHKLTVRERLELLIQVCKAIQHAHQKGVIHRDIKPSNVLVTETDGEAIPKVIDFGVAKALQQPLTDHSIYTGVFQAIGTLAYMSPEQATLGSNDVDTRSDVYGLGALLFELLTGTPPFGREQLERRALDEALRIIREQDAPKPSTRISGLTQNDDCISRNRGTDSVRLGQLLRGDLDWIVMKSVAKDRQRRYDSAASLSSDVKRFLNDEPVDARPPSTTYLLQKYVRRHKTLAVSSIAIVGTLFVALAISLGALRAAHKSYRTLDQTQKELQSIVLQLKDALFDQGMSSALRGEYADANKYLDLLRETGGKERALQLEGFLRLSQGDYDKGVQLLKSAVDLHPRSVALRALLTVLYDAAGQPVEWFKSHRSLTSMQPESAEDLLFAAIATYYLDPYLAEKWADEALKKRRTPLAFLIRARAFGDRAIQTGELAGMSQAFEDASIANAWLDYSGPAGFTVLAMHLSAANALAGNDQMGQRSEVLEKAKAVAAELESKKDKMPIWDDHYLGKFYYEVSDYGRSLDRLRSASLPDYRDNPTSYYLALAYELDEEPDQRVLNKIDSFSVGPYSELNRAFLLITDGHRDDGMRFARRIVSAENPLDLSTAGLLLFALAGRHDLAKKEALILRDKWTATELDPWNSWVRDNLLQYFIDDDEESLLKSARESKYKRRWLTLAHSTIAASRYGHGEFPEANQHAIACVDQHVIYLTDHVCWRALLARPKKWEGQ